MTYEVHHEENQRGGRMGFHGKRGAQCPFKWSMFSNGSGTSGSSQSSEDQKENLPNKPAEAAGKSEEETSAPAAEEEGATGEKSAMSTSPADPQKKVPLASIYIFLYTVKICVIVCRYKNF